MNRTRRIAIAVGIVLLGVLVIWMMMPQPADVIFVNGKIRTMSDNMPRAEAMSVYAGKIVGVGSTELMRRKFRAVEEVDLGGSAVLPGLIDAHAHFLSLGISTMTVDLVGSTSAADAADRVRQRVRAARAGQWIRGRGWDQNLWPGRQFPSHETLDRIAPEHPVVLGRVDGHALWVNARAMAFAGITRGTPDPPGGRIIRDAKGMPTGILIDNAKNLIVSVIPLISDAERQEALLSAQRLCLSVGLTGVHDMGVDTADLNAMVRLIDDGELHIRLYAAVGGPGPLWERMKREGPLVGYGQGRLTVRALKLYADGALGSRGAALIEPYADDPENRGLTVTSEGELRRFTDEAVAAGFQVCTHAIGDRGNNIILNVYDSVLAKYGQADRRLRVEHAQVLHKDDIPRFAQLHVLPSMQPTHCTSDMYWAESRLGAVRVRGAYAWRSLLQTGVVIPCGSDFPVEHPNPLAGIYAAITRRDKNGQPKGAAEMGDEFQFSKDGIRDSSDFSHGWYGGQRLTLDEALRGFTVWAAYSAFEENERGSIEPGKLADFILLSRDLDENAPENILTTTVRATYIGGRKVYKRGAP